MAQFKSGDLREEALARVIVDWQNGNALFCEDNPAHVQGTLTLSDGWEVTSVQDVSDDDSSKQWVVPAGQEWQILGLGVIYTSSAGAGDRQLDLRVQRAGYTTWLPWSRAGVVQAASTTYEYMFAPGVPNTTTIVDDVWCGVQIPVTSILRAGDTLRVWDNKAIAAGADEMYCWLQYAWRTV